MKKIITIATLALATLQVANAKKLAGKPEKTGKPLFATSGVAQKSAGIVSGTMFPESFGSGSPCGSNIYTYRDSTFGYYAGVNVYGDKELLMRYSLSEYGAGLPATVDTVKVFFGAKYVGSNGMVRAKVYSATGPGAPSTLLGTSADKSVSSLDTSGGITNFVFTSPVNLTTATFFVAVDVSSLYASGDTVGIFSTDDACATTNLTDAWTKQADNNFYAFSDAVNNFGFALDMAIFAHGNANSLGVKNIIANPFAAQAYPVPAEDKVNISFTGVSNGMVSLALKDITGRMAAVAQARAVPGSQYTVPFDVSMLGSGLYFVELSSGTDKSVLKVNVR